MNSKFLNMCLSIVLASGVTANAFADSSNTSSGTSSAKPEAGTTQSYDNSMAAGRMSAGGGVQPSSDKYSDGDCKGVDCPDEGLQQDSDSYETNEDNTDNSY